MSNAKKPDPRRNAAARAAEVRAQQRARERNRNLLVAIGIVAVLAVVIGLVFALQKGSDDSAEAAKDVPANLSSDGFGVTIGDEDAPKTVEVYEDFQCPICHLFEESTKDTLRQQVSEGKIKIEYRMVSFLDDSSKNDYSSRALNAAMVVLDTAGPDAFLKFHDTLYANQPQEGTAGPEDDQLIEWAVQSGADEEKIKAPIEDKVYEQWVENATDAMSKQGVTGTPTVFVDGTRVEGQTVDEIIANTLAGIGAGPTASPSS